MQFRVDQAALKTFASGLDTLESAAHQAGAYAEHTDMGAAAWSGSLLQRLVDSCHAVEPQLKATFAALERVAGRSAEEVRRSADYYRRTDAQAAADYETQQLALPTSRQGGPK